MTSAEFSEWLAYFRLLDDRPSADERRADWRHAAMMTLLANAYRDRDRRPQPFTSVEFLPRWDAEPEPELTDEQLLAKVMVINAAMGGKVRTN